MDSVATSKTTFANPEAELTIHRSPLGTPYVSARDLHTALRLNAGNYSRDVRNWLNEEYGFADDLRLPVEGKDFAPCKLVAPQLVDNHHSSQERTSDYQQVAPAGAEVTAAGQDYWLQLHMAKLVTLSSKSPVRKEYVRYLLSLETKVEDAELVERKHVVVVVELAKVMGMISMQKVSERHHFDKWLEKGNSKYEWVNHRASILGYTTEDLKLAMLKMGRNPARRNRRKMIMQTDKYELIRAAVLDLLHALGKPAAYAHNMAELAYDLAKSTKMAIWNDVGMSIDYTFHYELDKSLIKDVKLLSTDGQMGLL